MKTFYCDICVAAPMKLLGVTKIEKGRNTYRIRKFICGICGYEKSVYADGYWDEKLIPGKGVAEANKLTEQDIYNEERPDIFE